MSAKTVTGRKTGLLSVIFGILGAAFIFISTSKYGPGLSHDSIAYIFASKSLLAGKGLLYFGYGTPFVQWPPLFPTLLALFGSMGINPVDAARYVNAFIFGVIIIVSGFWLYRNIRYTPYKVAASTAILLSVPLIQVSGYVWSEPLFILFILSFLMGIEKYLNKQKGPHLILLSAFAALACLTRYAGITAIIAGVIILLLQKKRLIKRLGDMAVFGLISGTPLLLWIIRNYMVSLTPTGNRAPSSHTLLQNLHFTFSVMVSWFLPHQRIAGILHINVLLILEIVALIALPVLMTGFMAIIIQNRKNHWKKINLIEWLSKNSVHIKPMACFILVYMVYLIVSATFTAFDTIDGRLLAPVYIPLMLQLFFIIDGIPVLLYKYFTRRTFTYFIVIIISIWFIYPLLNVLMTVSGSARNGLGIQSVKQWRNSELIGYLGRHAASRKVYSNFPEAIHALAGIPAEYVPRKGSLAQYGLGRFREVVKTGGNSYIAWFDRTDTTDSLYSISELQANFDMEVVTKTDDGTVYSIK